MANGRTPEHVLSGLLNYFTCGVSEADALANLLKSQESQPKLFPRVDYREVNFWYESFRNNNFNMYQIPPEFSGPSQLQNLDVLDDIIEKTSVEDQKALRRTCKSLKAKIDKKERTFEKIGQKDVQTIIQNNENGCTVLKDGVATTFETNWFKKLVADFKQMTGRIKTKIAVLNITNHPSITPEEYEVFLGHVSEAMGQLKRKLNVEQIDMRVASENSLDMLLKQIQPNSLTSLELSGCLSEPVFPLGSIPSIQDHWQYLKTLTVYTTTDLQLETLANLDKCDVTLSDVPQRDIASYRNSIVHNSNFVSHVLDASKEVLEAIKSGLEPYTTLTVSDKHFEESADKTGLIPFADSSKGHIKLVDESGFLTLSVLKD
uniref:FTH domain-containing protein n=1 Tax=Caenorhabditis tropicalis TaxID=1561998 RepID=A0A1I7U0Y0_9PELO